MGRRSWRAHVPALVREFSGLPTSHAGLYVRSGRFPRLQRVYRDDADSHIVQPASLPVRSVPSSDPSTNVYPTFSTACRVDTRCPHGLCRSHSSWETSLGRRGPQCGERWSRRFFSVDRSCTQPSPRHIGHTHALPIDSADRIRAGARAWGGVGSSGEQWGEECVAGILECRQVIYPTLPRACSGPTRSPHRLCRSHSSWSTSVGRCGQQWGDLCRRNP